VWLSGESSARGQSLASLRAGFAKAEITPDRSADLMGYGLAHRGRGNDGVNDPLFVRACCLKANDQAAYLVSFDLCVLPTDVARKMREHLCKELAAPPENVLLAATHTHSGPYPSAEYFQSITPKVINACRRAEGLTFPVTAAVREAPLGIAYDRRVMTDDGVKMCFGPQEFDHRTPTTAADPTCTLLALTQANGPRRYLLWSLGAHPVTLGKTSRVISADYPGRACEMLAAEEANTHALFTLGACGHSQPWIATQENPAGVEKVARAAASFVSLLAEGVRPITFEKDQPLLICVTKAVSISKTELDLTVWRLGDTCVVGAPVELFGELAVDLRRRLGGPVLLATLAGGWELYCPTAEALKAGGYEAGATRPGFQAGDGEKLIDEIVALAKTLRDVPKVKAATEAPQG